MREIVQSVDEKAVAMSILLGLGLVLAHPFRLLSNRVMYSGFENSSMGGVVKSGANKNFFRAVSSVYRENGFGGFFRGFLPYSIFIMAIYHA